MSVMLKLKLPPELQHFKTIQKLDGLADLNLDEKFGLVCVDPKEALYIVRSSSIDKVEERKKLRPELIDTYGDIRIEGIKEEV